MRLRSKRIATGIRRRPNGTIEAYVEAAGHTRSKTFPPGTPRTKIELWRASERHRLGGATRSENGTLAADLQRHLPSLRTNASYPEQKRDLERWCERLGERRRRNAITRNDIEQAVNDWMAEGCAAGTMRKRLQLLQAMWTNLDGRDASNPVKTVRRPAQPPLQARGLHPERVRELLNAMRQDASRAICGVIAWTGLTHTQVRELTPADIDWTRATVRTRGRRKGKSAQARIVPLLHEGITALRAFDAANLYGKVNNRIVWGAVKRAGRAIGEPDVRPYDLRHSFATLVYAATGDLTSTGYLLGHTNTSTTRRYALNAVPTAARNAIEKAEQMLEEQAMSKTG